MRELNIKNYKDIEDFRERFELDTYCGKGNIIPHEGTVSKNRGIMFNSASNQYRAINKGEAPIVDTIYSYNIMTSSKNVRAEHDMNIVYSIEKTINGVASGIKSYIFHIPETDTYHYLEFQNYQETGAGYGVKMIADIPEDGRIKAGDYVVRTNSYGDDMVYQWGVNAVTALVIDVKTIEDAGMISDELAEKMIGWKYQTYQVIVDTSNDVLKNVYGTSKIYKPFPSVGEDVKEEILMAISKNQRNHQYIKVGHGTSCVNKIDKKIFAKGKVVDITVRQKVGEECQNSYLRALIQENREYETRIFEIMKELKDACPDASFTPDFEDKFYKLKAFYEVKCGFKYSHIIPNSHVIIDITVVDDEKPSAGQKITGRCGNKFTTTKVYDTGKYYTKEFGNIDYMGNCLALFNRAIMLVPLEMYQCYISMVIYNAIKENKYSDDKMKEIILTVLNIMDKRMCEAYRAEFEEHWEDFKEYPMIHWIQSTYHSGTDIKACYEARNYLNSVGLEVKRSKIYTTNEDGEEVCIGSAFVSKMFITPLKQVAGTQLSLRAKGSYDSRGIIIRDDDSRIRNTPVRKSVLVGDILSNILHPDDLHYIYAMTEQESAQVTDALMYALGVRLKKPF